MAGFFSEKTERAMRHIGIDEIPTTAMERWGFSDRGNSKTFFTTFATFEGRIYRWVDRIEIL